MAATEKKAAPAQSLQTQVKSIEGMLVTPAIADKDGSGGLPDLVVKALIAIVGFLVLRALNEIDKKLDGNTAGIKTLTEQGQSARIEATKLDGRVTNLERMPVPARNSRS